MEMCMVCMESVVYLVSVFSYKVCCVGNPLAYTALSDGASYRVQSSFWGFPSYLYFYLSYLLL